MKKYAILIICFVLVTTSCDKITNPIIKKDTVVGSNFITKTNESISHYRKVLLEDYTGQRCINCPRASAVIKNDLMPIYQDSLVVIAVHAGGFAKPFGEFIDQDFRTPAGDEWDLYYKVPGYPTGIINKKNYAPNGLYLSDSKWTTVIPIALKEPFIVKLDVTTEYDPGARALNTYVKATFQTGYTEPVQLVVFFEEDGIVGKQEDNTGHIIEEYEFEHMLRGDINGYYGSALTTAAMAAGDSIKVSYLGFPLPTQINDGLGKSVNDNNVSVVVIAYDKGTKAVLQVEKLKIR